MKELLSWAWTIWCYLFGFGAVLAIEVWIVAMLTPKEGFKDHRILDPIIAVGIIAVAAFGSYMLNNAPATDCPADYDRQGIHSTC